MKSPLILGAGPAGLGVASHLAKAGIPSILVEKEQTVGGLGATFESDGYRFDLGPHVLHPKDPAVSQFIQRTMGHDLLQPVTPRQVLSHGRIVDYPIKGLRVLTTLPPHLAIAASIDFIRTRAALFLHTPAPDSELSFEAWVRNRFGPVLYGIYFGPYVEKVWKMPGRDLSVYVAHKRVPVTSIRDQIRGWLHMLPRIVHDESGRLEQFYCRRGTGQLFDILSRQVTDAGSSILTGSEIVSIKGQDKRIRSVVVRRDGVTQEIQTDFLFSTIPLSDFIGCLDLDVPGDVRAATKCLDYCAERILYLKIRNPDIQFPALLYFAEPSVRFNRVSNINAFSRECVPEGRSALCVEFTCNVGDELWSKSEDSLYEEVMGVFEKYRLVKRNEVEGYVTRQVPYAYPRFRVGFERHLATIRQYVSGLDNMRSLGRHGDFNYSNIDDVFKTAFDACDQLLSSGFERGGRHG